MRNAFASEVTSLAGRHDNLVLLAGDIGNRLFNGFKDLYPDRFFNCGVAEGSMTGVAAGMAMCGLRPVTYTITPFNTYRCLEQIRVDLCYHNLPVVIIGTGSGLSYAGLGATHHSCEDIAMMRVLPNMTVLCPGDSVEVRLALRAALNADGPVYIRLGKKNEPVIHETEPEFEIGRGIEIMDGNEVCVLSTGNMLPVAVDVGNQLEKAGISCRVVSMHTVKPLDVDYLDDAFSRFRIVAAMEEHSILGGFGASISEWLTDREGLGARLLRFGTTDRFLSALGDQANAREKMNLTADNISSRIQEALALQFQETLGKPTELNLIGESGFANWS